MIKTTVALVCISAALVVSAESALAATPALRQGAPAAAACSTTPLGAAGDFNGYFLKNVDQSGSGTGGRLAVGGDATFTDYSVGTSLPSSEPNPALVVGGDLRYIRGAINGAVVYGGTANIANASVGAGGAQQGHPLAFGSTGTAIEALATRYGGLKANGRVSGPTGMLVLKGTAAGLNVFHVKGTRLAAAHSLSITVPNKATALVVVRGATSAFRNLGISLHGVNGARLLFDLPSATTLTIKSVGLKGSILAPMAAITFTDGAITGTLIGSSLSGTGHLDSTPFTGCLPAR
jgi:choice-of-anchor A domain-containing protein